MFDPGYVIVLLYITLYNSKGKEPLRPVHLLPRGEVWQRQAHW